MGKICKIMIVRVWWTNRFLWKIAHWDRWFTLIYRWCFFVLMFNRYVELPEGMIWFSPWNNTVHWHTLQETTVFSVTYRGVRLKVFLNRGTFETTKHVVSWNVVSPMKLLDTDLTYQKKHVLTHGLSKTTVPKNPTVVHHTPSSNTCPNFGQRLISYCAHII